MAVTRSMSKINIQAPPPSPIPTATGSRSAANEVLTKFLEKSLHIPDLALPESQGLRLAGQPDKIDFQSLGSREAGSVDRFLRSARKFGVVSIWRHEIDRGEELKATVKEAARVFGVLEERDTGFAKNLAGNRDEIVWVSCKDERLEWARQYIGVHLYHSFSEKIEKVASKLEEVAEELGKILVENTSKPERKGMRRGESLLSIYKYNNNEDKLADQNQHLNEEENDHSYDYVLSLHLPTKHCQFSVKSGPRLLTFDAAPDTIILTFGQQLQEWSMGEFKCVRGRIIYPRELGGSKCSFSLELKLKCMHQQASIIVAESLALRLGSTLAKQHRWQVVMLESDCKSTVDMANGTKRPSWDVCAIMGDIRRAISSNVQVTCNHVLRAGNKLADWLAKKTLSGNLPNSWVQVMPPELYSILNA